MRAPFTALALAAGLAAVTPALAGCRQILGIEDTTVGATGDGGGTPDAAADGGGAIADASSGGDAAAADARPDSGPAPMTITIAAGNAHTCATGDGRVRCWGFAQGGRLGYGNMFDIGDSELPSSAGDVNVATTTIDLVSAGGMHTCAVGGFAVFCWGAGGNGRLGYGNSFNIGDNETPNTAGNVSLVNDAVDVAAGGNFTCARLIDGTVSCWGAGSHGQLGYGNTNDIGDNETPASVGVVSVGGAVDELSAGGEHVCARLGSSVRCWGSGSDGQLGYGNLNNIGDNEVPASVGDVNTGVMVAHVAVGLRHTCVLDGTGKVRCWGYGGDGQLGYGDMNNLGDNEVPSAAGDVDVGGTVNRIALGDRHTCARIGPRVTCWGYGGDGALGYGNTNSIGDNETPATAGGVDPGGDVVWITAGGSHTCAILTTGAVKCWGLGANGRLGYGDTNNIGDNETPATVGPVSIF